MKRIGWMAAAGLAALAVAGCQKKTETAQTNGTAAPAAATAPAAGAAAPARAPAGPPKLVRKAGLWEMSMSSERMKQTTELCIDPATDEKLGVTGQRPGPNPCRENKVTPTAGGYQIDSVCDLGEGGTLTTHGTMTGDPGSHYRVDMTSSTSGAAAPSMNGRRTMTMEATWKGPCPAGMHPGDMMVNGMKIPATRFAGAAERRGE